MVKHTPGPWIVSTGIATAVVGKTGRVNTTVAHVLTPLERPDVMEANARLIAAAPELLEALRAAIEDLGLARCGALPGMAGIDAARAAIAKAEGE